jgi:hypothetical protein
LHRTPEDHASWHLVILDAMRRVTACVWYLEHASDVAATDLRIRHCPAGLRQESRQTFWTAIETELRRARDARLGYAEIGGWAVARECRCSSEGLILALAAYGLGRFLGGALGMTTATVRHSSSTILRRIGGAPLETGDDVVHEYFDPKYQCWMEVLRFDSRRPNPRYAQYIDVLKDAFVEIPVVSACVRRATAVEARVVAA